MLQKLTIFHFAIILAVTASEQNLKIVTRAFKNFAQFKFIYFLYFSGEIGDDCGKELSNHGYCEEYGSCLYFFNKKRKNTLHRQMSCENATTDLICCPDKLPLFKKRVMGGTNTPIMEYPYMVLLEYIDKYGSVFFDCSGILVHEKFVLTAAHCLTEHKL